MLPAIVVFLGLLALAFVTRWGGLAVEVFDWDESTFILVAADILRGGLPYGATFDNKPPLQPMLLAGAMALFGESLTTVRALGMVSVAMAGAGVWAICRRGAPAPASVLAGAMVVAAGVAPAMQGTMTEHMAMAFMMPALWLVIARKERSSALALAGALMAGAALCRSNLALPALVLLALVAFGPAPRGWRPALAYALGLALPLCAIGALYLAAGQFDRLVMANLWLPLAYSGGQTPAYLLLPVILGGWVNHALAQPWTWGPFTALVALGLWMRRRDVAAPRGRADRVMAWVGLATLASMAVSGAFFHHHLFQLVPFAAWLGCRALHDPAPRATRAVAAVLLALMLAAALAQSLPQTLRVLARPQQVGAHHVIRQAAEAIAADRQEGDGVLALEGHLVYWYLGLPPPTPVAVHPSNLVRPSMREALVGSGVARPDELATILARRPRYIVTNRVPPLYLAGHPEAAQLRDAIAADYAPLFETPGIRVFRRH